MKYNKYTHSSIYKIVDNTNGNVYVGSTIQTLKERLNRHKTNFRNGCYCSSQEILKQGNYKIVLIKDFDCNSLIELETEETKYQRNMVCINKRIARLTDEERKQNKTNIKWFDKINCDCGGTYTRKNKTQHNKTTKHKKYLKSKTKFIFKIKR